MTTPMIRTMQYWWKVKLKNNFNSCLDANWHGHETQYDCS